MFSNFLGFWAQLDIVPQMSRLSSDALPQQADTCAFPTTETCTN